jgi:hypothetical protein
VAALNAFLLQNHPESVDHGGHPKQKTQNNVKDRALRRIGFQINGERGQQNRKDDEQQFIHEPSLRVGRLCGKTIFAGQSKQFRLTASCWF